MGLTASGKTAFVDHAVGRRDVGYRSTCSMKEVSPVRYPHPDGVSNIVLVDTPGFDDTFVPDAQIHGEIAQWLNVVLQREQGRVAWAILLTVDYSRLRPGIHIP